jgi:ribosomal protein L9
MATTADEVWALLGQLIESQKESRQETERQMRESRQETERQMRESRQETERQMRESRQEVDRELKALSKQTQELGKQIGGLGKKFGSFTEGLALPSMERILQKQFGMEIISPSVRASKAGQHLEIDVLAYANGDINTAYVVEVKSHPREESITQLKTLLQKFRIFFPEHSNKKLRGILAAVDWSEDLKEQALKEGLYVARIHDEVFELETPKDFQPREW